MFFCGGDDELAGGDETLLVGETDGFAGADRGISGFEAGDTDDCGDDEVYFRKGGDVDAAGGAVEDFDVGDAGCLEAALQGCRELIGGERDGFGAPAKALVEGYVNVAAGSEGDDLVAVGKGLADGEGAVADGAGGSEDGEFLHKAIFADSKVEARGGGAIS